MIANGKQLFSFIDALLINEGFIRKKDTWYLGTEDCIVIFSLGKSPYGGHYDHVIGCFLKELMEPVTDFPLYYKNHLRFNIDNLVTKDYSRKIFDLENTGFKNDSREIDIRNVFVNHVIPYMRDVSSRDGIIKAVHKYKYLTCYMNSSLKERLNIQEE